MNKRSYQSIVMATFALAIASASHQGRKQAPHFSADRLRFHCGSRGVNMSLHIAKMVGKRHAASKMARAGKA